MKRALIALALAAALPLSAQAGELNYNYVGAAYASTDLLDETFDGYAIDGSVAFNENFYGNLSYRNVRNGDFDINFDETVLSVGYRHAVSDKADFIAELGYVNVGVDLGSFGSDNTDGYRVAGGFRGMLAPKFEAGAKVYYTHLSDMGGGDFGASINGIFHINKTWGIVGSYDHSKLDSENVNTWGLGVRASF
jgi:hypothetical protein